MNLKTKELFEDNVKELGLIMGRGIKGKGTEIFSVGESYSISAMYGYDVDKEIDRLIKSKDIYVDQIRYKRSGDEFVFACKTIEDIKISQKRYPIKKVIEMLKNKEIISLVTSQLPKLLGHISLSHYDDSFESQKDFVEALYRLKGYEVEWDEDYLINLDDYKYKRADYEIVHGYPLVVDDAEYFDGRSYEYCNLELEDFWNYFDGDVFDYIDPDRDITVYHRKGKDWYVAPAVEEIEITLYYKNDDGEEDWEVQIAYIYKENKELVDKALNTLSEIKASLIMWSKVDIDLGLAPDYTSDAGEIANLYIIDNEYNQDRWDARSDISQYFDKAENNYELAYHMFLEDNLDEREYLFGKYKHLPMAREMFDKKGMKITHQDHKGYPYVVEYKNELYHFYLGELYKVSPQDFVKDVSEKLQKRIQEKLAKRYIYQNASKVFVSVKDSLDSGNCKFGTQEFVQKHKIDTTKIGGVRGDVLLEMVDKDESNRRYVERAVLEALKKKG